MTNISCRYVSRKRVSADVCKVFSIVSNTKEVNVERHTGLPSQPSFVEPSVSQASAPMVGSMREANWRIVSR